MVKMEVHDAYNNKIRNKNIELPKLKRVAAYARVSVERGRTLNSYSAQVSYYNDLIQKILNGSLQEFMQI